MQNKCNKKGVIFIILLFIISTLAPVIHSTYAITYNSVVQYNGDITYDVYFGTTSPPTKVLSNQTETSYNPGALEHDMTYYWQIIAWDDQGNSADGPIWSFSTGENQMPVAIIVAPSTGDKKVDIIFDGSTSYDPDGYIVEYLWVFSDGGTGNGSIVTHQFISSGIFTVTLQVKDDDGGVDQTVHEIFINNHAPIASIVVDTQYIEPGDTVTFDGTDSYDPDGDNLSYLWELSDGTIIGTEAVISYTFTMSGVFIVTLTVTDDDPVNPMSDSSSVMIYVNAPPIADLGFEYLTIPLGIPWTFNGSNSYDPDGYIVNYTWDFDNGDVGYGMSIDYMYWISGTFLVTLTVMDDNGAIDDDSGVVFVLSPLLIYPLHSSDNITKMTFKTASPINIIRKVNSPEKKLQLQLFPPRPPSNPFPEDGAINVSTDVVLSWECSEDNPPDTPIVTGETDGKIGVEYMYCINPVVDPDGDRLWVFWDWGDGHNEEWLGPYDSGDQACANHSWDKKGTYTIKVRLKDDYGALSDWGSLQVNMPIITISYNPFLMRLLEKFENAFSIRRYIVEHDVQYFRLT
ncbi:hypothetical protein AYK25_02420 [Thermoplasmatales archaeon SM1-50]|nr:MAG: hypothetical protein AYK25_02420 [Thermoplasmatales archaeon SM1-50]